MNVECGSEALTEIESAFRFNDAVLRHLTLSCKEAVTEKSAMMKAVEREESGKSEERKPAASEKDDEGAKSASAEEPAAAAKPAEQTEAAVAEAGVE